MRAERYRVLVLCNTKWKSKLSISGETYIGLLLNQVSYLVIWFSVSRKIVEMRKRCIYFWNTSLKTVSNKIIKHVEIAANFIIGDKIVLL